jgi:hypothetical protein
MQRCLQKPDSASDESHGCHSFYQQETTTQLCLLQQHLRHMMPTQASALGSQFWGESTYSGDARE